MQKSGLIGFSGFVGTNIVRSRSFDSVYNSKNIEDIDGAEFDTLWCAAAPGSMHFANKHPDKDLRDVSDIISRLASTEARQMILISSIAVLENFGFGLFEDDEKFEQVNAYGRHRRLLEEFCIDKFPNTLIVRLPALFGFGLKKNFLFDLLNPVPSFLSKDRFVELDKKFKLRFNFSLSALYTLDFANDVFGLDRQKLASYPKKSSIDKWFLDAEAAAVYFHNPESTFQYYDLRNLVQDVEIALTNEIGCLHLVAEPVSAAVLADRILGLRAWKAKSGLHQEDVRTKHGCLWGKKNYQYSKNHTINTIEEFFRNNNWES